VCTLTRRLTLKVGKAFSTSLHLWFCIWIPIAMIKSIIISLFIHRRNRNQRWKLVWQPSTYRNMNTCHNAWNKGRYWEELHLVKCVFICSRRQSFVVPDVPLYLKSHYTPGHTVLCLRHRPTWLTYMQANQVHVTVCSRLIDCLFQVHIRQQCWKSDFTISESFSSLFN